MKRFGIALLPEIFPSDVIIKYSLKAEKMDFHSIWIPEHYFFRDALTLLGAISVLTKKIKLATGIINLYTRHPALIAMSFASLNELSEGRVIAGVGLGVHSWLQQMGIKVSPSKLLYVKETVNVLRRLLNNEKVTYASNHLNLNDVKLGFNVPNYIPIYLAAVNFKMLELAGEIADGVLLTAGCSPKYVTMARKMVQVGIGRRKNSFSAHDVAAIILTSTSHNPCKAKKMVRRIIAPMLLRHDRTKIMLEERQINSSAFKKFEKFAKCGNLNKASTFLDFDIIDSLSASGTIDECLHKIQQYCEAGVDLPILLPINLTSLKQLMTGRFQ